MLFPKISDLKRFVDWYNPEYIPVDVGQSVESAIANTIFGYDMVTTVFYLFNSEYPSATEISDVANIDRKVSTIFSFPLHDINPKNPECIIERWQGTVKHLRERTPQSSALYRKANLTETGIQTDQIKADAFEVDIQQAAKRQAPNDQEEYGQKRRKEELDQFEHEKSELKSQITNQSRRITEVKILPLFSNAYIIFSWKNRFKRQKRSYRRKMSKYQSYKHG